VKFKLTFCVVERLLCRWIIILTYLLRIIECVKDILLFWAHSMIKRIDHSGGGLTIVSNSGRLIILGSFRL
jgi:hypothetical protein